MKKISAPIAAAPTSPIATPRPVAAPLDSPPEDGEEVEEELAAAAVEDADDELPVAVTVPVLVIFAVLMLPEPELLAASVLSLPLVLLLAALDAALLFAAPVLATVTVSSSARGRETKSPFCANGWLAHASLIILTKFPSTTLPSWLCRQAAQAGASAGKEPDWMLQ